MNRAEAYKCLLIGNIVKHKLLKQGEHLLCFELGSMVPPVICYYKYGGPYKIVWSDNPLANNWCDCSIYDPIFMDDNNSFEWSIYEEKQ